ncbi:MAG: hypothetical protein Q9170_007163 [Blastenia crenularia]
MPTVPLYPPHPDRGQGLENNPNSLPQLLQTPSGLAILELQGTINVPLADETAADNSDTSTAATEVGRVVFPDYQPNNPNESNAWMKRVHLYIGRHQRLTGEVKKLTSPLAVIRRKQTPGEDPSISGTEELEITEIIYYKMLFSSRPEPKVFVQSATSLAYGTALSLFLFVIWAILVSIRNAYFHPLSKFPGPKSAAATPIPFVKNLIKGDMVTWVMGLHAKYGEVVRVTPDELSFITPSAWQDIYTTKPQLPKCEKGVVKLPNGVPNLSAETVTEEHTRQRKILSYAFSERALREQEDILKRYTDLLITKLHEQMPSTEKPSATLDITQWYNYTTFDTVGDLCFNEPFHSLDNSADHLWVQAIFRGLKFGMLLSAFQQLPPMPALVNWLMPQSLKKKGDEHWDWLRQKIARRIETKTKRPDFMTYILDNNKGVGKMSRGEIESNADLLVIAGSETSATTSASSTYYFLTNPAMYERLREEVLGAFKSMDEITVSAAARLPYLRAVITEALRLHPSVAISLPRLVDRPGVVISGHEVPVGTMVGVPPKTMFRSPNNFVDSNSYVPERWLPDADPKYDADRKEAHEPFMVGPRNCIGRPYAEDIYQA